MRYSEAIGRKVVSTSTANTVGVVKGFVLDPKNSTIAALSLQKTAGSASYLPWPSITAFGADAVTVAAEDVVVEPDERIAELDGKHHAVHGKRVLTTNGQQIGTVQDVDVDPGTGQVQALLLEELAVEGPRLLGVGSYAVVVQA